MTPTTITAFRDEFQKIAIVERLVRLGATDIPNTPRLLMKHRGPATLAGLQNSVEKAGDRFTAPIHSMANSAIDHLPSKVQPAARGVAKMAIDNPEILPMQAVPIPGLTPAYLAGKKGLEKLIDRVAPLKR